MKLKNWWRAFSAHLTDRYQTTIEDDPILADFLNFLASDIKNNPSHVQSFNQALIDHAYSLTANVDIDLDASLDEKDE